ncbi:MAG TPA: hypothetical protein VL442_09660 [Mucilaginibacter sp.]|jgi:hypothetical protein|nr:hypothetical protein [Mucilaginibacter sp.]
MRNYSIVATIALLIPITCNLFYALQFYYLNNHREFGHVESTFVLRSYAAPLIGNIIFVIVALILNVKRKYYENCIMCITVVAGYIMFIILNYGVNFFFQWLK